MWNIIFQRNITENIIWENRKCFIQKNAVKKAVTHSSAIFELMSVCSNLSLKLFLNVTTVSYTFTGLLWITKYATALNLPPPASQFQIPATFSSEAPRKSEPPCLDWNPGISRFFTPINLTQILIVEWNKHLKSLQKISVLPTKPSILNELCNFCVGVIFVTQRFFPNKKCNKDRSFSTGVHTFCLTYW